MKRARQSILSCIYAHNCWGGIESWLKEMIHSFEDADWSTSLAVARGKRRIDVESFARSFGATDVKEIDDRTGIHEGRIAATTALLRRVKADVAVPLNQAHLARADGRAKREGAVMRLVVPLVGSFPGLKELTWFREGETARSFPCGDIAKATDAVEQLAEHPEMREAMSRACVRSAEDSAGAIAARLWFVRSRRLLLGRLCGRSSPGLRCRCLQRRPGAWRGPMFPHGSRNWYEGSSADSGTSRTVGESGREPWPSLTRRKRRACGRLSKGNPGDGRGPRRGAASGNEA